jgi:hypothetical protein
MGVPMTFYLYTPSIQLMKGGGHQMTITEAGGIVKYIAARKLDIGGNSMNLIRRILTKMSHDGKKTRQRAEGSIYIDDYGYALYYSLEYNPKHLKNDDSRLRESLLKTIII